MGLFKKKPTLEQLEDRKDYLKVETEVASKEAELAEQKVIIKELKKKYGSGWKSTLGLKGRLDLQTLRSFVGSLQKGAKGLGKATYNPSLSPLPRKNIGR